MARPRIASETAPLRVLLVEDDESASQAVRDVLGDAGRFDLQRVISLAQAEDLLAQDRVDVILLDLSLADSAGVETLQRVQRHAEGAAIIVVTGIDDEATAEAALKLGAQDCLVKGELDGRALLRAIRHATERQRALGELRDMVAKKDEINDALRLVEARYRSVTTAAGDAMVVADGGGTIVDWNPAAEELFGYPADTARTLTIFDLLPGSRRVWIDENLRNGEEPGTWKVPLIESVELPIRRADEAIVATEWSISTWQVEDDCFLSAMIRDIAERKAAERLLVEEAERLVSVVRAQQEIADEGFDQERIIRAALRWTSTLTRAAGAAVFFGTEDGGLECVAAIGEAMPEEGRLSSAGREPATFALARWEGKDDPQPVWMTERDPRYGDQACLAGLLTTDVGVVGVLLAVGAPGHGFEDRHRSAFELVGGFGSTALTHLNEFDAKRQLVTERTEALTLIADSEERFRQAFENAPIGVALVSLEDGKVGRFLRVNDALREMAGRGSEELVHEFGLADLVPSDERGPIDEALGDLAQGAKTRAFELRVTTPLGKTWWLEGNAAAVSNNQGQAVYAVAQLADVTARREAELELRRLALHDVLTGLPNRNLLIERLERGLRRSERSGQHVAVLFVDLDRFKAVNDTLGHQSGDDLLVAVANRIQEVLRPTDTAARLGGDEFIVVCEDIDGESTALEIANRLHRTVSQPCEVAAGEVSVSASVGIYLSPGFETPEEVLSRSDTAMYRAKERGRNRCEVLHSDPRTEDLSRSEIAQGLQRALDEDQLRLYYQHVQDLSSGRPVGAEVLLRWEHPDLGVLEPDTFLPVAEETGLIVPIGRWVFTEACRRALDWTNGEGPKPSVWINVSARQATGQNLGKLVAEVLEESGLPPDRLCLELTETVLQHASAPTLDDLRRLADTGVRIGIDDFGIGHASLSSLADLPVSFVKIDSSLVAQAPHRSEKAAIVKAVIGLAHSLDRTVIAEGVETLEQLEWVTEAGCQLAQGICLDCPSGEEPFVRVAV